MNAKEIRRKNLRALAHEIGGISQLANRLQKSQSQISHLIGANPVKNIGDKFAANVEKVFNKPHGWLDHQHFENDDENTSGFFTTYRVPIISWHDAADASIQPVSITKEGQTFILTNTKVSEHAFAVPVDGDSMESPSGISFPAGVLIIVDPEHTVISGSFVVAKPHTASQLVFKQLVIDGGRRYLKPLNPRYPVTEITPQAMICGVVRLAVMEFK